MIKYKRDDKKQTYIPIISPSTSSQATLRCGVDADAELLRPAMPVLDQNSQIEQFVFFQTFEGQNYEITKVTYLPSRPQKVVLHFSDHVGEQLQVFVVIFSPDQLVTDDFFECLDLKLVTEEYLNALF